LREFSEIPAGQSNCLRHQAVAERSITIVYLLRFDSEVTTWSASSEPKVTIAMIKRLIPVPVGSTFAGLENWEILSCEVHYSWIAALVLLVLSSNHLHWKATWTVRQKCTGIVKRVTADNKFEAADQIARGLFDSD
jgi:hypothetical protein